MSICEDEPWDDPEKFQEWVEETTGWDGKTFSLSEAERFWIAKAEECLGWFRTALKYPEAHVTLAAAFRCLRELPDMPGSLKA